MDGVEIVTIGGVEGDILRLRIGLAALVDNREGALSGITGDRIESLVKAMVEILVANEAEGGALGMIGVVA